MGLTAHPGAEAENENSREPVTAHTRGAGGHENEPLRTCYSIPRLIGKTNKEMGNEVWNRL